VVLEADTFPDTATDTVVALLPGASNDEAIILNTHTDGPNATEENGALGLVALAKYFSKISRADRRRTLVFPMTTGHFAGPWVPSIRGFIQKHPDLIKKTVAAVTVEHLGCREWLDEDAASGAIRYRDTGGWSGASPSPRRNRWPASLSTRQGSRDRAGVANPVKGGCLGRSSQCAPGYPPSDTFRRQRPLRGRPMDASRN
jgi:hypothetical protein